LPGLLPPVQADSRRAGWLRSALVVGLGLLLLALSARPATAQGVNVFMKHALGVATNDDGETLPRYTAIASVGQGRVAAGMFHLTHGGFSLTEVNSTTSVRSGRVTFSAGGVLSHKHSGKTFTGPMVGAVLNLPRVRLTVPVARYLWQVHGGNKQEWAFMAEAAAGPLRAAAVFFGPAWEFNVGSTLPRMAGITPEVRVLQNRNGPGLEMSGTWTR
jgi:hypothetical protein